MNLLYDFDPEKYLTDEETIAHHLIDAASSGGPDAFPHSPGDVARTRIIDIRYVYHDMRLTMSRILIDLTESQLEALAKMVKAEQRPRASIIRDAIETYLSSHKPALAPDVFGLWKSKKLDGLEYQQELRSEW
jgi:DNA-binding phage protein